MINLLSPTTAYAAPVQLKTNYALGGINSLGEGFTYLVSPGFQIAAVAVILYFIIGSVRFITSAGDKEAIAGARAMMTHAIIGFILLMLLFATLQFIPRIFGLKDFNLIT